jgi:hypothetical protein
MKINDLVKSQGSNRIGVISRVLKRTVEVRWSENHFEKLKPENLELLPLQWKEALSFTQFARETMTGSVKSCRVILGNELMSYTRVGWIFEKLIEEEDLLRYPRVVNDHVSHADELGII